MLDPREEGHPLGHALGRMMGMPREDVVIPLGMSQGG